MSSKIDIVLIYTPRFFYRHQEREVDFILENTKNTLTALEVKYKENIAQKELRHPHFFTENFSTQKKLCISKNIKEIRDDIEIIPFWEEEKQFLKY